MGSRQICPPMFKMWGQKCFCNALLCPEERKVIAGKSTVPTNNREPCNHTAYVPAGYEPCILAEHFHIMISCELFTNRNFMHNSFFFFFGSRN